MGLRGMRSLQRKVQHMQRNLGDEVRDAVHEGSQATTAQMRANVANNNAVWTGNLMRQIYVDRVGDSRYRILADAPYAAFVEFGTGPSQSPGTPLKFRFDAPTHTPALTRDITAWVMTKPVFFGPRTESVAWAIARSISIEGTSPQPYMRPAWFETKPVMMRNVRRAVKRVVRRG